MWKIRNFKYKACFMKLDVAELKFWIGKKEDNFFQIDFLFMLTKNPVISCIIVFIIFLSIFICVLNVHCYSFLFTDIDECKESDVPVCSQVCLDVKGHYKCSCVKGYKMESILGKPGKTTCKIDGMHEL